MKRSLKIFLTILLQCILSATTGFAQPSIEPQISEDIAPDIRDALESLLNAYNRSNGAEVYRYLETSVKESVFTDAYKFVTIPISNVTVSSHDANAIEISYDSPRPGDMIATIFEGKEDLEAIKRNLSNLLLYGNLERRTETWHIIRLGEQVKFDCNNKGFMYTSAAFGIQTRTYCIIDDKDYLNKSSDSGIPIPNRLLAMVFTYLDGYGIDRESDEGKLALGIILRHPKIIPFFQDEFKEVSTPEIRIKVPMTWMNLTSRMNMAESEGLMYGTGNKYYGSDDTTVLYFRKVSDSQLNPNLRNKTDHQILEILSSIIQSNFVDSLVEFGETEIGGVESLYLVLNKKIGDTPRKTLMYMFVKNGISYNLSFICDEDKFDENCDLFIKIKNSLEFRHRY